MLVRTTLVRVLYFSARDVTAWPQLWKAIRAMGTRTCQGVSSLPKLPIVVLEVEVEVRTEVDLVGELGPQVKIEAAMTIRIIWKMKETQSTQRRLGVKRRWKRLKMKEPMQKAMRDTPDLIQRLDSWGAARPRPM